MSLHVTLTKNNLPNGLPKRPRVVNREPIRFDTLLGRMSMDTALNAVDMRGVFDRFSDELLKALADGRRVETPIGDFTATVRGKRNGDPINPEITAENVEVHFRPDSDLVAALRTTIEIETEHAQESRKPIITSIYNHESKTVSTQMSAGQTIELRGSYLGFPLDNPDEGVFFLASDGTATPSGLVTRHGTAITLLQVPVLAAGEYTLAVRTKPGGSSLREGKFETPVTIL